jgi:hypothetical protein
MTTINEERVVWSEVFYAETFDFRSRLNFCRYDECTFVRCTLLIDHATEQLAFTGCTFKDCNIDHIDADEARDIVSRDNTFHRPLEERRKEFDDRLAAVLRKRDQIRCQLNSSVCVLYVDSTAWGFSRQPLR